MSRKPVEEMLRRMGEQAVGRAIPGGAPGQEITWEIEPFKILIATVLSQRTRDESTHQAAERLFAAYPDPASLAAASPEEVDELIRAVNFHYGKAKAVRVIASIIHERYGDKVPSDMDSLLSLPMVGRKTANCVLAFAFGRDAICVDTHVHRVSNRIGLVHTNGPDQTEEELKRIVPRPLWRDVNAIMVRFGQQVCTPQHPKHSICSVREYCDCYNRMMKDMG